METLKQLEARHKQERAELEKKLAEVSSLPTPRIEVVEFMGKNGGFAIHKQRMYKCVAVGVSGKRESYGYPDQKYATEEANDWRAFTSWPVFFVKR